MPALRPELVTALIRSLPKDLRRPLVPVPEVAAAVLERLEPRSEPLLDALARELERLRGVRVPREAFDVGRLPPHLRMGFRVEDERGALVAEGDDLDALRERARPRLRAELAAAAAPLERHGLRDWTIGTLAKVVTLPGTGQAVRGYPALVDEGDSVGVRVLETPEAQREAMHAGTRKLIALNVPVADPSRPGRARRRRAARAGRRAAREPARGARGRDGRRARGADRRGGRARLGRGRLRAPARARRRRPGRADRAGRRRGRADPRRRARGASGGSSRCGRPRAGAGARGRRAPAAAARVPGLRQRRPARARLADVERYLRAAARRLERLPDAPAPDLDRMRAVHELEAEHARVLAAWPPGKPLPAALREVRWMLEELRVSHFAQALGTRGQVSSKRIRRVLEGSRQQ